MTHFSWKARWHALFPTALRMSMAVGSWAAGMSLFRENVRLSGQHKAIVLAVKIVRRLLRSGPSAVRSWPCCSRW